MTLSVTDSLVTHVDTRLDADPSRVLARLFVPGHELPGDRESRATDVLARILALPDDVVSSSLTQLLARYERRHRDLPGVLGTHYDRIAHRIPAGTAVGADRRRLLGAAFTREHSVEGTGLCNPSVVLHPDQSRLPRGSCRFLLSLRAVGAGNVSSVEFRTGVLDASGELRLDPPGPHVEEGRHTPSVMQRGLFTAMLAAEGADAESGSFLIGSLPERFGPAHLDKALVSLTRQQLTRHGAVRTGELARLVASRAYEVEFPTATGVAERVLWPVSPPESRGIEDARFVRCTDDGVTYRATYSAFDGERVTPHVMETADFRRFRMSPLAGRAAKGSGMALFPRKVNGLHVALSRWDRESCAVVTSRNGWWWEDATTVHVPTRTWELLQTGNCGSPLETPAGWLVLTHGVGLMREYAIGALLLALDDPSRVIGVLPEPLLTATDDEREGCVPNVVYSCGSLLHGDRLLLPYGVSHTSVRFAIVDVQRLLDLLTSPGARPAVAPAARRG